MYPFELQTTTAAYGRHDVKKTYHQTKKPLQTSNGFFYPPPTPSASSIRRLKRPITPPKSSMIIPHKPYSIINPGISCPIPHKHHSVINPEIYAPYQEIHPVKQASGGRRFLVTRYTAGVPGIPL